MSLISNLFPFVDCPYRSFKKSKVKVLEWLVLRPTSGASTQVLARHGLTWEDAILLQSKVEVAVSFLFPGEGASRRWPGPRPYPLLPSPQNLWKTNEHLPEIIHGRLIIMTVF